MLPFCASLVRGPRRVASDMDRPFCLGPGGAFGESPMRALRPSKARSCRGSTGPGGLVLMT
jgi:hypothetical protein